MLPLILVGAGAVMVGLGSREAQGAALRQVTSTSRRVDTSDDLRLARLGPLVERLRGDVPAWLLFGHMATETGGRACPTPTTPEACVGIPLDDCAALTARNAALRAAGKQTCLDERGVMGVAAETRCHLQLLTSRICDPAYALAGGVKEYKIYAAALLKIASFLSTDDLWRAAYFVFAVGATTAGRFIPSGSVDLTWTDIARNVGTVCGRERCKPSTFKAVANNDRMWNDGHRIAVMARQIA